MESKSNGPKTLMQAIRFFGKKGVALRYIAALRWPETGPVCEKCGLYGKDILFLENAQRWKCRGCKNQFSVKRGTIMEDSALPLDKWLCAIWMISNCRNGISSYEIARGIGVTQKSAWFMLHRIRLAMETGTIEKLKGTVEADETYIGPKVSRMNKASRRKVGRQRASQGKTPVMGIVERNGEIRTRVLEDVTGDSLREVVRANVEPGSRLFTDSSGSYKSLGGEYEHDSVNHLIDEYVRGEVHTNTVENFWTLLKRALRGTYVNVEPFHLFRYVEEQVYRFNRRKQTDQSRFEGLVSRLFGKRLTYAALTAAAV